MITGGDLVGTLDVGTGMTAVALSASDQDRERTVDQLRRHTADGVITLDEFGDRVGLALAARSVGELLALVSDLPVEPVPEVRPPIGRRWVVAVMSGSRLKGRWRAGRSVTAMAVMGGCEVDLRRAEFLSTDLRITAVAVMGGVEIIVPEGVAVELRGIPIMGGKHLAIADVPVLPGSPVITVRAFPFMGGVSVRSKPGRPKGDTDGQCVQLGSGPDTGWDG